MKLNRAQRRALMFKRDTPNDQGSGQITIDRGVIDLIKQELQADMKADANKSDGQGAPAQEPAPEPAPNPEPAPQGDVQNAGVTKPVFKTDLGNSSVGTFGTDRAIKSLHTGNFREDFKKHLNALALNKTGIVEEASGQNLEKIKKYEENMDAVCAEFGITGRYLVSKAYNTGTIDGEDGSAGAFLIPPPEALIGIERYESEYGVSFNECNVRTTNNREIYAINGEDNVELVRLGEGAAKSEDNPSYSKVSTELTKAAIISFATDELISDDVHGFVNDLMAGFGRARGKLADELVYTDDGTNSTSNFGLLEIEGTSKKTVGTAITDISWEAVIEAYWATLAAGRANIKIHLHPTVWGKLTASRNELGTFDWNPSLGTTTPFGIPAVLPEILPSVAEVGSDERFGIIGDFKKTDLVVNGGLMIATSNTAVRGSTNAWTQDLTSFRAVTRMAKLVRKPERYTVLHTGTVVS